MSYIKSIFNNLFRENLDPGGMEDRHDPRDFDWREIAAALPTFDWKKGWDIHDELRTRLNNPDFILPVKNQNGSLSCGGQAYATYGSILEALSTGTFEERSAKFIYSQVFVEGGGSAGRDCSILMIKQGLGKELLTSSYLPNGNPPPEDFMERSQDISDEARADAKLSRALSYIGVSTDIDSIAQAAAANHGLVLGIRGTNNGSWYSTFPIPPGYWDKTWNHWIYVGGAKILSDGKKAIHVFNSWGDRLGEKGWQWITQDYFKKSFGMNAPIFAGWTMVYNDVPIVRPLNTGFNFTENMVRGEQSDNVKNLQLALQLLGFFLVTIIPTGYYGNITANAVYAFQVANNIIPPDRNNAGPRTRTALNIAANIAAKQLA